jgi:PPOX class probable F420-dependent enzyme
MPAEVDAFLRRANPAVIATLRPDGAPHCVATWYLWDGQRMLVNMADSRRRLDYLRGDGRVALTALGDEQRAHHVSILGHVTSIEREDDRSGIDSLARHYSGEPFHNRGQERWNAWIEVDQWHGWEGGSPWPKGS